MSDRIRPLCKGAMVVLCLVLVGMLVSRSGVPAHAGPQVREAALRAQAVVDHGDPLIRDERVDAMDRGRYPYQDLVCGAGCGAGLVNVVFGNLVYTRRDLSIPGRGLPLEVSFTYNSGSTTQGRYGRGWQMNYGLRYVTNSANDNVIVAREDDRTDIYVRQVGGSLRATYGVRDTLVEYAPDRYRLTDRAGVEYWFESPDHHYVTRIVDRNGNALTLAYGAQRELTAVTDGAGRQLLFSYTGDLLTQITDPAGRTVRYAYDANGDMVEVTDPLGHTTRYTYSPDCHDLLSVTDARGHTWTVTYNADFQVQQIDACCGGVSFAYDRGARQTTVTDANGDATRYTYDHKQRVIARQDALGHVQTRTWDDSYALIGGTDANGHTTSYTYDGRGNLLTRTDALGYTISKVWHPQWNVIAQLTDANGNVALYDYDAHGNLVQHVDPMGHAIDYTYDPHGQMVSRTDAFGVTQFGYDAYGNGTVITDALGHVSTYAYDPVGNRIGETDANGHITTYAYDLLGRLVAVTNALGNVSTYSYDPVGNRIGETDANGNVTAYSYDALNRPVAMTDTLGYVSTYSYDPVGNQVGETDALGHVTTYSYDPVGNRIGETDALGYVRTYSYDPVGNRIGETDANGRVTTYSYDPLNRLVQIADALGGVTTYSYDPVGNRIGETDANGHVTTYSYDPLNRLVAIADALGATTTYSYDPLGNRVGETDPTGGVMTYVYDPVGNQVGEIDALGHVSTYSYDPGGNRIGETDAAGNVTTYSYDPLNRLVMISDALAHTVTYTYDPVGNLLSRIDSLGRVWQFKYDARNRCIKGTSPMGHETVYAYDAVGNRVARLDPNGLHTAYSYDAVGRMVSAASLDGTSAGYVYDGVGNLLSMAHTGGLNEVTTRTYDALDRLVSETIDYGPFTKTVSYAYDLAGNLLTLTDPDGRTIAYAYDAANRPVTVTDSAGGVTALAYDLAGRQTEIRYPHGMRAAYGYDAAGQLESIVTYDATDAPVWEVAYAYDPNGRVIAVTRETGIAEAVYTYNAVGWLTRAQYATGQDLYYSYDPAGNRTAQVDGGSVISYTYNAEDRVLDQVGAGWAIAYTYDANANVVQTASGWGVVDHAYDAENRLVATSYPPPYGAIATYYSPEGQRLARDERGQWTYYYPTRLGVVVEMDASGNTVTHLNPEISLSHGAPPGPVGAANGDGTTYVHWDGRDSTTQFTDSGGAQAASFGFGYFGEMLARPADPTVIDAVDPALYAGDRKVDWDPMLGAELIGGDYAPDIAQHYGGTIFDPDALMGPAYGHAYGWVDGDLGGGAEDRGGEIGDKEKAPPERLVHPAEHCRNQFGTVTRVATRCKPTAAECTEGLAREIIPQSDLERIYQAKCEGRLCPEDEQGCRLVCKVEIDDLSYEAATGEPEWCKRWKLTPKQIRECIDWAIAEGVCEDMGWVLCRLYARFSWRCECK
ncbi:MAG: RHS repeat protein [Anaerolineae bacterium]|nr:RHS repeat protein [Anaerolineae bacterium]